MSGGIAEIFTNEELMRIKIRENREPIANIHDSISCAIIRIEKTSRILQRLHKDECFLRIKAIKMLANANENLPRDHQFKIIDGYRPMSAQVKIYNDLLNKFRLQDPKMSLSELRSKTDKWVANPKVVPPHTTGGALDLTIVDKNLKELDMGTRINTASTKANTLCNDISIKQRKNRGILIDLMVGAGFVNNPREWWHWSFGDRRWAAFNKTSAVYGAYKNR
jgi:zinc D-Ala-D-Ala dipeptidase